MGVGCAGGFGNGAFDWVKTTPLTSRSGVALFWMSGGAVSLKPKLRVSPGTNGSTGREKFTNSIGVTTIECSSEKTCFFFLPLPSE